MDISFPATAVPQAADPLPDLDILKKDFTTYALRQKKLGHTAFGKFPQAEFGPLRRALCVALNARGRSAREIAMEVMQLTGLPCTRNTVIGWSKRVCPFQLTRLAAGSQEVSPRKRDATVTLAASVAGGLRQSAVNGALARRTPRKAVPQPPPQAVEEETPPAQGVTPMCEPVHMADLKDHHCRYIVTLAGADSLYCGQRRSLTRTLKSYCAGHAALMVAARQPARPRQEGKQRPGGGRRFFNLPRNREDVPFS